MNIVNFKLVTTRGRDLEVFEEGREVPCSTTDALCCMFSDAILLCNVPCQCLETCLTSRFTCQCRHSRGCCCNHLSGRPAPTPFSSTLSHFEE